VIGVIYPGTSSLWIEPSVSNSFEGRGGGDAC